MIHLYTGDGKGKTTAAVGLATRALGHGRREHNVLLRFALAQCRSATPPDLLVLDEFTYIYNGDMADRSLCEELLACVGARIETVLTGRDPGPLADRADYLTEMKALRHPFDTGTPAREGIEF